MQTSPERAGQDEEELQGERQNASLIEDALEDDGTPVLDEIDLEEAGLSEEEADNIEWEDPE